MPATDACLVPRTVPYALRTARKGDKMNFKWKRMIIGAVAPVIVCLLATTPVSAQNPQLAGDAFINVPSLGNLPVDEFMDTMGMFSNALNLNCTDCHTAGSMDTWAGFGEETPKKATTRNMIAMVNAINRDNFGGVRNVTCYTCHRGDERPKAVASLSVQYGTPIEDPNEYQVFPGFGTPSIDAVFDDYIEALGGEAAVENITSYVARGSYAGYDTDFAEVPVELFAKAPDQYATIIHGFYGDSVKTYDGADAWISSADRPVPLLQFTGGNLDGARLEALLAFPTQVQEAFRSWRVNYTAIDDVEVIVVQGSNPGELPVNLYFDESSGLLVRYVRWTETAVGTIPTEVSFSDYREVSGVQMPFQLNLRWTNGESIILLTDVGLNVQIDDARFARPAPAEAPNSLE